MIDEEWLKRLDFVGVGGLRIHGLAGLGSDNVVFNATAPDGKRLVTKVRRHHLGFHIKEIPLFLSEKPLYEPSRVNNKLLGLVGNTSFDEMTCEYDRMFSSIVNIMHTAERADGGAAEVMAALLPMMLGHKLTPYCPEAFQFALATPFVERRFAEIASLPDPGDDPLQMIPRVNGSNFPITGHRDSLVRWAQSMLEMRRRLLSTASFEPETLADNPMFIWGAAVMDGFFTDDELPQTVAFIEKHFGKLPKHAKAGVLMEQIDALGHLLVGVLKNAEVQRFIKLCGMLGFLFQINDADGREVASSMNMLRE